MPTYPSPAPKGVLLHSYQGQDFLFREDGYFNMTKAAKAFGKRDARNFFANKETKEYLEALAKMTGIPVNILKQSTRGRIGGTWGHPKLAVFFARWLDVRFAVVCDLTIDNILKGNLEVSMKGPIEAITAP